MADAVLLAQGAAHSLSFKRGNSQKSRKTPAGYKVPAAVKIMSVRYARLYPLSVFTGIYKAY